MLRRIRHIDWLQHWQPGKITIGPVITTEHGRMLLVTDPPQVPASHRRVADHLCPEHTVLGGPGLGAGLRPGNQQVRLVLIRATLPEPGIPHACDRLAGLLMDVRDVAHELHSRHLDHRPADRSRTCASGNEACLLELAPANIAQQAFRRNQFFADTQPREHCPRLAIAELYLLVFLVLRTRAMRNRNSVQVQRPENGDIHHV